jgi:hypothetical protein
VARLDADEMALDQKYGRSRVPRILAKHGMFIDLCRPSDLLFADCRSHYFWVKS